MTKVAWRLARIILGFILLGMGVVGLLLPIVPQVPFFIAGLLLLAREYHWARRLLDWAKRKWHAVRHSAARAGE